MYGHSKSNSKNLENSGEILKLTKKLQSFESLNERLSNELKEESSMRQNIERKTFQMNESFNSRFSTLKRGFDDLASVFSEQVENIKEKVLDEIQVNNEKLVCEFEKTLNRIEKFESNENETMNELNFFKSDINSKLLSLQVGITKEIKDASSQAKESSLKLELLEKKSDDNFSFLKQSLKEVTKDLQQVKNEVEKLKNFKENTILNFKDISEEFIKGEETFNDYANKISEKVAEFENKVAHMDSSFNLHNDNFLTVKKDIYAQICDNNLSINTKLQEMRETFFDKIESFDKSFSSFRESISEENEKFANFMTDKVDQHHISVKKLVDYVNQDIELLRDKTEQVENLYKTMRSEFFHNLNEVEEFLIKKYENLSRSISVNSERL